MNLLFSDDRNKLTDEVKSFMDRAFQIALRNEFPNLNLKAYSVEVGVTIVTDNEIQSLNKEYRSIDKVTDVLSFPQFESKEYFEQSICDGAENLLGDVVICYEKASTQAEEYGTGIKRELVYLFVHSIFHLLGYDHMTESDKSEMRAREDAVMEELGL